MSHPDQKPALSFPAALIVCERKGTWAAALRRAGGRRLPRLREVRSLQECYLELAKAQASLVLLEIDERTAATALRMIVQARDEWPRCEFVVVCDRHSVSLEETAREAGAVHFLCSQRQVAGAVPLIERHFARLPQRALSVAERIWESLPWDDRMPLESRPDNQFRHEEAHGDQHPAT